MLDGLRSCRSRRSFSLIKSATSSEVTNAQARKRVLLVALVLFLIVAWNLFRGRTTVALVVGMIACALVLSSLILPALARRFHIAWMRVAGALSHLNNRILLSIVFYLLFVPYNLVMRLVRRDPLNRRKAGRASYWIPRATTRQPKEQFERLF